MTTVRKNRTRACTRPRGQSAALVTINAAGCCDSGAAHRPPLGDYSGVIAMARLPFFRNPGSAFRKVSTRSDQAQGAPQRVKVSARSRAPLARPWTVRRASVRSAIAGRRRSQFARPVRRGATGNTATPNSAKGSSVIPFAVPAWDLGGRPATPATHSPRLWLLPAPTLPKPG